MAALKAEEAVTDNRVHANCGCTWTASDDNPVLVVQLATAHVVKTGHTVDVLGRIVGQNRVNGGIHKG